MQAGTKSRPVRHGVGGWRAQAPESAANGRAVAAPHAAEPLADFDPAVHWALEVEYKEKWQKIY